MRCPPSALAVISAACVALPTPAQAQTLVFSDVSVVDVREGHVLADMTVVISGDRVARVGPGAKVEIPPGARVIDGTGRFLIPGLWDMHVHTTTDRITREIIFPLLIAHGVTGIRSMAADCFETGEPNCEEAGSSRSSRTHGRRCSAMAPGDWGRGARRTADRGRKLLPQQPSAR
jgi:hypothetical protein